MFSILLHIQVIATDIKDMLVLQAASACVDIFKPVSN